MPRASSTQTITRQWELLKRLPKRPPGMTAGELTEWLADQGHKVSKRTVERDLNELSRIFALRCNTQATPFYWYWMKDAQMDLGSVELPDAVSLTLAEQLLKEVLPSSMLKALEPKFAQAKKKLAALDKNPMARLTNIIRYSPTEIELKPPSVREQIGQTIQKALVEQKQIKVRYARFNDHAKEMTLDPLGFVQRGPVPYLIARVIAHEHPRIFALHRFEFAEMTPHPADTSDDFDIDDYLDTGALNFGSCQIIQLKAKLSERMASYLSETPISRKQKINYRDGHWILEAEVQETWQLQFWILSKGADFTVLSPKSLREEIFYTLKRAVKNYEKD